MDTSPAAVKEVGSDAVIAVCDTENIDEPLSLRLNKLPIDPNAPEPFGPTLIDSKSPVAVTAAPGVQSMESNPPVVNTEDVELKLSNVPVV